MFDWPPGTRRYVFDTIDSTMAEARRQASVEAGTAWFLSYEQTAGTGRRGRAWDSQKGNFAASLLIRPGATPDQLALRSFVTALALYDTLVALTGRMDIFSLKWPNDVLLRGGKLAGILLETLTQGNQPFGLIIGVGVNLRALPSGRKLDSSAIRPASLKQETGICVTPDAFLDALAPAYARWETQLQTYGFEPIRTAWLEKAANIGQTITARLPRRQIVGTFKTVDERGALILQAHDRQHVITAAQITF